MIKCAAGLALLALCLHAVAGSHPHFKPPNLTPEQLRQAAEVLDPELMRNAPPANSFLDDTKNPCWLESTGQTHCLPYAYVAGTFQAGAVGLFDKLSRHPRVVPSSAAHWQFWGEDSKSASKWVHQIDDSVQRLRENPSTNVLVDGSLSTFGFYWSAGYRTHRAWGRAFQPCWQNCSRLQVQAENDVCRVPCYQMALEADRKVAAELGGTDVHVPMLISALYGERQPKIVVVLRNPSERLHAAYWEYHHYTAKYGRTPEGFLTYVTEQIGAMRQCEKRGFSMRECALYFESLGVEEERVFFHCDQIIRGMYSVFLEVWLHYFKQNVLVIRSEEYFANPMAVMERVFGHLGFEHADLDDDMRKVIEMVGTPRPSGARNLTILPEAKKLMREFYAPFNDALARLTSDNAYLEWNKDSAF